MAVVKAPLDPSTVVVAVDPGKVMNRVWVSDGSGWLEQPVSVPVSGAGVEQVERLVLAHLSGLAPVIAVEATGSLHRAFVAGLEGRFPGSTRLSAPSETRAARTQLGSARFKTDDRHCAALTYLAVRVLAGFTPGRWRSTRCGPRCGTAGAGRGPEGSPATAARPAQRALPGSVGAGRARPGAGDRKLHRTSRAGLRGGVRGPGSDGALAERARARATDEGHGPLLDRTVERVPRAAARRCRTRPAAGP